MRHFDVRLKLNDVIGSNLIISLLLDTIKKLPIKKVLFWHNSDISDDDIDNFFIKWKKKTDVSLELCDPIKYAWFDIISKKDNQEFNTNHRFKYIYSNKDDIITGIFNFYHTVNFVGSGKKKEYK